MTKKQAKGFLLYRYNKETGIEYLKLSATDVILTHKVDGLMSGDKFLENVLSGCITGYDGFISRVYVDGYESNLGLSAANFNGGRFLVDESTWREICEKHKVEVDWANN